MFHFVTTLQGRAMTIMVMCHLIDHSRLRIDHATIILKKDQTIHRVPFVEIPFPMIIEFERMVYLSPEYHLAVSLFKALFEEENDLDD
jgi:hypothetical protein